MKEEALAGCERVSYEQAVCHDCGAVWEIPLEFRDADEAIHKCPDEWRPVYR